jgi:hypothetical protein
MTDLVRDRLCCLNSVFDRLESPCDALTLVSISVRSPLYHGIFRHGTIQEVRFSLYCVYVQIVRADLPCHGEPGCPTAIELISTPEHVRDGLHSWVLQCGNHGEYRLILDSRPSARRLICSRTGCALVSDLPADHLCQSVLMLDLQVLLLHRLVAWA